MDSLTTLIADPAAWAALVTLVVMEVVLGIDNLVFISILTNKLPPAQRAGAQRGQNVRRYRNKLLIKHERTSVPLYEVGLATSCSDSSEYLGLHRQEGRNCR